MRGIEYVENFFSPKIVAITTNRRSGFSDAYYESFNLGLNVGDNEEKVVKNRNILQQNLKSNIIWMNQTHSCNVHIMDKYYKKINSDGIILTNLNYACAVSTADCLPILVSTSDASIIGAVHAGWKGLSGGILNNFYKKIIYKDSLLNLKYFNNRNKILHVWFGPCICKKCFFVGNEVKSKFINFDKKNEKFFVPHNEKKWKCDLKSLAIHQTVEFFRRNIGFYLKIKVDERCTYEEDKVFFSYRRDGKTGRMASVITRKF